MIGFGLSSYTVYWFNLQAIDELRTWVLLVNLATYLAQICKLYLSTTTATTLVNQTFTPVVDNIKELEYFVGLD